ncbi:hypothetical protein Tco_0051148 [Tanacetum coccineum]
MFCSKVKLLGDTVLLQPAISYTLTYFVLVDATEDHKEEPKEDTEELKEDTDEIISYIVTKSVVDAARGGTSFFIQEGSTRVLGLNAKGRTILRKYTNGYWAIPLEIRTLDHFQRVYSTGLQPNSVQPLLLPSVFRFYSKSGFRLQRSASNARFILIIGWDAFGLPSEQYAIEVTENMLGQGCLDWNTEVLYGFKRQQSKKGKGGRNHHQELIPESIGRMKMKGALVSSRNAIWPVDEEEQKNNLLGEKFTELVNNSTDSYYRLVFSILSIPTP